MKIVKYQKKKANEYEITLSNNDKISLYDDVILKFELLLKKEIEDNLLKEIISYNNYIASYNIALKYLNSKLRTEKEIRKKLDEFDNDAIEYTICRLKKEGYLNKSLYIKAYINDEVNLKFIGPNKIKFNLKKLGFNEIEIEEYLNKISNDIWLIKIDKYISKKIKTNHNLAGIMLKQKVYQDLLNKGFESKDINIIINEYHFSDSKEVYEKELQKVRNKLSKKYSGEELEYNIKIALLKKGFKKDLD